MVSSQAVSSTQASPNDASAAAATIAEDKAVNLYSVLEVAPDTNDETIRRRINEMFLEAQRNFDHRNFRRRFYYQELFEVHLPQARFHLLDPERRRVYDLLLKLRVLPSASNTLHEYSNLDLPSVREDTPSRRGADGLDLNALPTVDEGAPRQSAQNAMVRAANAAAQALQTKSLSPADQAAIARFKAAQEEPALKTPSPVAQKVAPRPVEKSSVAPAIISGEEALLERRRDMKRRELIKYELMAVGTQWAAISAFGTLAIGIAAWFGIQHWIGTKNAGASFLINLGGVVACCFIAAAVGRTAHREARRRTVALLSQMPYEQLLRRCAQR